MPLGFWVFACGLLLAIIGGAKPSREVGAWPDTTIYFIIGVVISSIGVYLWRQTIKREVSDAMKQADSSGGEMQPGIKVLFENLSSSLSELGTKVMHLNAQDLHDHVEAFIDLRILPIVESRYELIHRFGMAKGAEIALEFAKAERMLNRVQTAALDGDLDEAHRCYPEAEVSFKSAISKLQAVAV